jgi:hypothetical protein
MPTKKVRTEHDEQSLVIAWSINTAEMQTDPVKRMALRWLHAIPNGFHRGFAARRRAKAEGVKSGVLDLFLPAPELTQSVRKSGAWHGLYLEMKRRGEKLRPTQSAFMDYLDAVHYRNALCYTWTDAAKLIAEHLDLKDMAPIEADPDIEVEMLLNAKAIEDRLNPPKPESSKPKRKSRPRTTAATRQKRKASQR